MVDIVAAAFDAMLVILALGISYVAFTLKETFAGGFFERAWSVIGMSPILYAISQGFEFWQAIYGHSASMESAEGVVQAGFLIMLLYGFYSFASAWRPAQMKARAG